MNKKKQSDGQFQLAFLEDNRSRWIKSIQIFFLILESESLPFSKKLNYSTKEIACNQKGVNNHDKRVNFVKPFAKERHSLINVAHPLHRNNRKIRNKRSESQ